MDTLQDLRRRLQTAEQLRSVVRTMRAMAAVTIRQARQATEALAGYNETAELGLHVLLVNAPEERTAPREEATGTLGAVVLGSDQGLVGRFNQLIATYAVAEVRRLAPAPDERLVMAVGLRLAARLEDAGQRLDHVMSMPGSVAGITHAVREMLVRIRAWQVGRGVQRVALFYSATEGGAAYSQRTQHLLPLSPIWLQGIRDRPWVSSSRPIITMSWDRLFSAYVRQYLFASLHRAVAESMASENASRLAAMDVAESNIEERIGALRTRYHYVRQSSITEQILDVVTGYEALREDSDSL